MFHRMYVIIHDAAHRANVALHSTVIGKSLHRATHGGHVLYLGAVFLESHASYGMIAGGLVVVFLLNAWLNGGE